MKNLINVLFVVIILMTSSFVKAPEYNFIGTYGVSENDPANIKLILNNDNTFSYNDFSNPTKKISVNGTWILKGKCVILKSTIGNNAFHQKWKFEQNGRVAKSRKGITFYTLNKCGKN